MNRERRELGIHCLHMWLISQKFWEIRNYHVISIQSWCQNVYTATLSTHFLTNNEVLSIDPLFSCIFQYHSMARYFWYECQDSTGTLHFECLLEKYVFIRLLVLPGKSVWYEVSLFIIDCKLARTGCESGQCSSGFRVVVPLFATKWVCLLKRTSYYKSHGCILCVFLSL